MNTITQHYKDNYRRLIKRMTFRAGTEWDAEDIVQETYARALRYIDSFDGTNFERWFNTILNNCLREHKNNEKGLTHNTFDEEEGEGIPCSHYPDRIMKEISDLIDTKSVIQIEVLNLHFKQGYSATDIAKITQYSRNAVYIIICRFRNELKELYG